MVCCRILLNGVTKLLDISMDIGDQELNKVPSVTDNRNTTDDTSHVINEQKQHQVVNAYCCISMHIYVAGL